MSANPIGGVKVISWQAHQTNRHSMSAMILHTREIIERFSCVVDRFKRLGGSRFTSPVAAGIVQKAEESGPIDDHLI